MNTDYVKPLSGNIVETCATMSWMQLTQQLLELTGESKYADAMERLMINHVFAPRIVKAEFVDIIQLRMEVSLTVISMGRIAAQQADTGLSRCYPPSFTQKKEKSFISINTCPPIYRKGFRI
jgi:hypothetical protein